MNININYTINKHKWIVWVVGLWIAVAVIAFSLTLAVGGQSKEPTSVTPSTSTSLTSPTPKTTDPLMLTPNEINGAQEIAKELQPLNEEAQNSYQAILSARTAAERCSAADRHWIAIKQIEPYRKKQDDWIANVRKNHNCEGCLIENGKLIKPPQPAQPPQSAQK